MSERILLEVLTLDSRQCPACGYMVDVIDGLPAQVRDLIEYKEWSIKSPEGIDAFRERGGKVLPTLCVDGRPRWESIIPTLDELYEVLIGAARTEEQVDVLKAALLESERDYE